jgi:hypothetical protein
MAGVTDREKLETSCRATVEWNFGQICDVIRGADIPDALKEHLIRNVRKFGNESIRVIANHLEFYNVVRNHRADSPNLKRVAHRAQGENHGD